MANYWAFLADPKRYRIEDAVQGLTTDAWVTKGRDVRQGDRVIIWKSAGNDGRRGVVALSDVLTDPESRPDSDNPFWVAAPSSEDVEPRVDVRYLLLPNLPLWYGGGADDVLEDLSVFRARGGTVFNVTADQWSRVVEAAGGLQGEWEGIMSTNAEGESVPRNPPWSRDELILALDLYFRVRPSQPSKDHPEIIALSQVLNALPIHSDRPDAGRFRNPNGVSMKLSNFLRFDPTYEGTGLKQGGKLEEVVWSEFSEDHARLRAVSDAIKAGLSAPPEELASLPALDDVEYEAPEGRLLLRFHKSRERNAGLAQRKKAQALQRDGVLRCEVCGFVYSAKYGPRGDGFIECHHTVPVSQLRPGQGTKLSDLALVCADCHRMLHWGGELLTVEALRQIVLTQAPTISMELGPELT